MNKRTLPCTGVGGAGVGVGVGGAGAAGAGLAGTVGVFLLRLRAAGDAGINGVGAFCL